MVGQHWDRSTPPYCREVRWGRCECRRIGVNEESVDDEIGEKSRQQRPVPWKEPSVTVVFIR